MERGSVRRRRRPDTAVVSLVHDAGSQEPYPCNLCYMSWPLLKLAWLDLGVFRPLSQTYCPMGTALFCLASVPSAWWTYPPNRLLYLYV